MSFVWCFIWLLRWAILNLYLISKWWDLGLPIRADEMGIQRIEKEVKMQIERWNTTVEQLALFIQGLECGINSIPYFELAPYQLLVSLLS